MLFTYSDLISRSLLLFVTFFGSVVTALVAGIAFHECSHAVVANLLGDSTAKLRGRISLNPARHLDPLGAFLLLFVGFGYGKPVPVNPARLRPDPKIGRALVSAAGPLSNLVLASIASLPLHFGLVPWRSPFLPFLIPVNIHTWDVADYVGLYLSSLIIFNVLLAVFNFLPIAPLDGFAVAVGVLPRALAAQVASMERYGIVILMGGFFILPMLTGHSLFDLISPIINDLTRVIAGNGRALA